MCSYFCFSNYLFGFGTVGWVVYGFSLIIFWPSKIAKTLKQNHVVLSQKISKLKKQWKNVTLNENNEKNWTRPYKHVKKHRNCKHVRACLEWCAVRKISFFCFDSILEYFGSQSHVLSDVWHQVASGKGAKSDLMSQHLNIVNRIK